MVTSGMVMYDTMKMLKSPVSTICMGLAASMGSILLSGGTKGRRFIFPHGEVMIHQPSIGGHYQAVSADLEIQAKQIKKTKEIGARILAENCGKNKSIRILSVITGWMPKNPWIMASWTTSWTNYKIYFPTQIPKLSV